jgi:hypothetical protein
MGSTANGTAGLASTMSETIERPAPLPRTGLQAPDGKRFPWGPIDAVHVMGPYAIVEYRNDASGNTFQREVWAEHGQTRFHPYIDGRDTSCSYRSLDSALVGAVAYRREGPNGRAAFYFDRMTL